MSGTAGSKLYQWNANDQECQNVAKELGYLQGRIKYNKLTKDTKNAYYMGIELIQAFPEWGNFVRDPVKGYFLKWDLPGPGEGSGRTQNRVVVAVDKDGKLLYKDGRNLDKRAAWLWRHDGRVLQLAAKFFDIAAPYQDYVR